MEFASGVLTLVNGAWVIGRRGGQGLARRIGVPREVLKHLAFCTQLVAETPALLEVSLNTRLHRLLHGPPQSRWVPEVYTISDHLNLAACWLILASHLEASALGKPACSTTFIVASGS